MSAKKKPATPRLLWDCGTVYDFFQSLMVLHYPSKFSVRGAWTAGMRARLSPEARDVLEKSQLLIHMPVHWIDTLPEPKNVETALWSLGQIAPEKRLEVLTLCPCEPPKEVAVMLRGVAKHGAWEEKDLKLLRDYYRREYGEDKRPPSDEKLAEGLDMWAEAETFGERYLAALKNYQEVFFAEEEKRIEPALKKALSRAQALAKKLPLSDLLEELSQGVRIDEPLPAKELVFAPSYWITPLMMLVPVTPERQVFLFGARPAQASLIPGETVPDTLVRALKALCDPTRLKILHYLEGESLAPVELARRLRLRTPTVMHHLHALRLAGLVQITISTGTGKEKKRCARRQNALTDVCDMLKSYLGNGR